MQSLGMTSKQFPEVSTVSLLAWDCKVKMEKSREKFAVLPHHERIFTRGGCWRAYKDWNSRSILAVMQGPFLCGQICLRSRPLFTTAHFMPSSARKTARDSKRADLKQAFPHCLEKRELWG